jgi:hypothetical protein
MSTNRMRSWRRIAAMRASKRRRTELAPPRARPEEPGPLPPLESPDDDREFLTRADAVVLPFVAIPRAGPA